MSTMRLLISTELSAREIEQRALKTPSPLSLPFEAFQANPNVNNRPEALRAKTHMF